MADNLPLIPNQSTGGAGVRGVLREVLGEQTARLPAVDAATAPPPAPGVRLREEEVRGARADQLSQPPPPHPYELASAPAVPPAFPHLPPSIAPLLLQRSDLMPSIHQNATRKTTLWVRNTLGSSDKGEGDEGGEGPGAGGGAGGGAGWGEPACGRTTLPLLAPLTTCSSTYSLSMGEPVEHLPPKSVKPPRRPLPEHIICVPSAISFVNFTVGSLYTSGVRLMNVSRDEVHLSVRPPARRELDVQLCGRLAVTSGASTQLCVHFRPRRLREVHDRLAVRVSSGRDILIPIHCYMVPPTLDVLMPHVSKSSVLSCELVAGATRAEGADGGGRGLVGRGEAVLDLGARLLGDMHSAPLMLRSSAEHAFFFILSDENWCSQTLAEMMAGGALVCGPFALWPSWWRGGGAVRGVVACSALRAGLHAAALRVLTSTCVVRPLYIIADSLYFHPEHISLQAQEKDYDILSDYDPNCEYYVNLGIAFPHRKLSETVQVINHSPLTYSFYWSVREWGVCSCEEREPSEQVSSVKTSPRTYKSSGSSNGSWSGPVCPGRARASTDAARADRELDAAALGVQPLSAAVAPRSSLAVHVVAADAGHRLGLHRAVLLLILKDVPRKSFSPGIVPQVVSTKIIYQEKVNGLDLPRVEVEVCEVVVCQMEVWWTVAPLRFVLDPPYMDLPYSRRLRYAEVRVRATLLYSGGSAVCAWRGVAQPPGPAAAPALGPSPAPPACPPLLHLHPGTPAVEPLLLPLSVLPNHYSRLETIILQAERREWSAAAAVSRHAELRHPALRPVRHWLGLVLPGSTQRALLALTNDTFQHVYWWADLYRIYRQVQPKPGCSASLPCDRCFDRNCSCTIVRPSRGGLEDKQTQDIRFKVTAPMSDGLVLTLVRARRTEAGVSRVAAGAPVGARTALLAYRTLAPAVTLAVLHCSQLLESSGCPVSEESEGWAGGAGGRSALLRPAHALVAGLRNCYRLRLRNITSVPTYVQWQPPPDGDSLLRVIFIPDQFALVGFTEIEISVVLEARRVSSRRVWLRAAAVRLAYQPLYLVIDAAIAGLEIEHWIPLADELICLRRIQREVMPWHEKLPTTPEEAFIYDDNRRAFSHKSVCRCGGQEMAYVSPPPRSPPAPGLPSPAVSAIWSPPPLTRVCACWAEVRAPPHAPALPLRPLAIQFRKMALNTVCQQTVRLRNTSTLTGKWSTAVRLGAMPAERRTFARIWEPWAAAVRECGVAMRAAPAAGLLPAGAGADITLSAYADTWGIYHDQLLIMMEHFTPLVVDVWAEAEGCPLRFPLRPGAGAADHYADNTPVLWVSGEDEEREVRAENASRAALSVQAYLLRDHGKLADAYPFRLVMRLYDMPPRTCPCTFAFDSDESLVGEEDLLPPDVDTGFELYLAPDYGVQDHTYYRVWPHEQTVVAGGRLQWALVPQELRAEPLAPRPPHTLLFRVLPLEPSGAGWSRSEPTPAAVRVRAAVRAGAECALQLSRSTITVRVCALAVPENDVVRIRKHIMVQNIGSGTLNVLARIGESVLEECEVTPPARARARAGLRAPAHAGGPAGAAADWTLVRGERHGPCGARCQLRRGARLREMDLVLPPDSSTEVVVEAVVSSDVFPPPADEEPEGVGEGEGVVCGECSEGPPPPLYATNLLYTNQLNFYDEFNIHKSVSLCVRVDRPALRVEPALLELGYVCDDNVRKTYFSVSHTSCVETVCAWVWWRGPPDFRLSPHMLWLRPGASGRVYVQYLARYTAAVVGGYVEVRVGGCAGAWCRARVCVRARAARDFNCHRPPHDYTDAPLPPPGPDVNQIF